jgi:hypothetical protein
MELQARACKLLKEFKGDNYSFGLNNLDKVGAMAGTNVV